MPAKKVQLKKKEKKTVKIEKRIEKRVKKRIGEKVVKNIGKQREKIIVTAALPYANGPIHIGHLLEYVQADIFTRFLKLQGKDALYICASDMHGTPVEVNARQAGKEPEQFANEFWKDHQQDFAKFFIQFDNYYKTHSKENKALAEQFFATLRKKGYIYTKSINTIYCENDKRYLPDRFVKGTCPNCATEGQYGDVCESCNTVLKGIDLIDPKCSLCGRMPIQKESTHYFFSLSKFAVPLQKWLRTSSIQPEIANQLQEWLNKGLEDWCISRDAPYFGFPIPESKKETGEPKYFYVWLDAPIGYISSTDNYCQKKSAEKLSGRLSDRSAASTTSGKQNWEDYWKKGKIYHFIGKDIIYFHYLFWPAMLQVMDIPLPTLTTHGFITVNGQKMSKSRGTFFTAKDFLKRYPPEALRFYYAFHLDRHLVDVDLNVDSLVAVNNNVLMGNIGNFCYRVLTFAQKNYGGVKTIADGQAEKELIKRISSFTTEITAAYAEMNFKLAVKRILQIADAGNAYFQQSEVWKKKDASEADAVESLAKVGFCVNLARNISIVAAPILPQFSQKIWGAMGEEELAWKEIGFDWKGKIKPLDHLVEKIDPEKIAQAEKSKSTGVSGSNDPLSKAEFPDLQYSISDEVRALGVKVAVAVIKDVVIKKKHEGIEKLKKELEKNIQQESGSPDKSHLPISSHDKSHLPQDVHPQNKGILADVLAEYELINKKTGVDSVKHPNSVAHLLDLVRKKGKLPQINTVVDLYNIVSLRYGISLATHDAEKVQGKQGNIDIRLSNKGEQFISLEGTPETLATGEVIYADEKRVLGRFSKQCRQMCTTNDSTSLVLVAFGNNKLSDQMMDMAVREACELIIQFNGGQYQILLETPPSEFPLQLVVGEIVSVQDHPDADSLYVLQVNLGSLGQKQVVAGIKKFFTPQKIMNKKVVFVTNIKPAKIRGQLSEAMILVGDDGDNLEHAALLDAEKTAVGQPAYFSGLQNSSQPVSFEKFKELQIEIRDGHVWFDRRKLITSSEAVVVHGVGNGGRVR